MSKHIQIQDEPNNEVIEKKTVDERPDPVSQPADQTPPEPIIENETVKRLQEVEQAAKDNYDRLLRVSAEFDNYKKRTLREMQEVVKYANEKLAGELLTVVDNLERAIESAIAQNGTDDPLVQGVSLVLEEITRVLDRHHVKSIKALGEPFDPALHQAMMQETTEEYPPNTVVKEMQKGYMIHDRLLRPTLVAVSATTNSPNEKNE